MPSNQETTFESRIKMFGEISAHFFWATPANPILLPTRFETAFDLDQAADTLATDNTALPGVGFFQIEGLGMKVSEAIAAATTAGVVGLVPAGGTPSTGAIAAFTLPAALAIGTIGFGVYKAAASLASPKSKIKAATNYELGIVTRLADGAPTGQAKEILHKIRPVASFAA